MSLRSLAVLVAVVGIGAFSLGAFAAWGERIDAGAVDGGAASVRPALAHPGRTLDLMAFRLTGPEPEAESVAVAEVAAATPAKPKRPPAPDVAVQFRRDVSAVLLGAAGPVLIMVDPGSATQRRVLRVGERYRDGWVVEDVDTQTVLLRRRQEIRTVELHSLIAADAVAGEPDAPAVATASTARRSLPRRVAKGG